MAQPNSRANLAQAPSATGALRRDQPKRAPQGIRRGHSAQACDDRKELVDLHKWGIVEDAARFLVEAHSSPGQHEGPLNPADSP